MTFGLPDFYPFFIINRGLNLQCLKNLKSVALCKVDNEFTYTVTLGNPLLVIEFKHILNRMSQYHLKLPTLSFHAI